MKFQPLSRLFDNLGNIYLASGGWGEARRPRGQDGIFVTRRVFKAGGYRCRGIILRSSLVVCTGVRSSGSRCIFTVVAAVAATAVSDGASAGASAATPPPTAAIAAAAAAAARTATGASLARRSPLRQVSRGRITISSMPVISQLACRERKPSAHFSRGLSLRAGHAMNKMAGQGHAAEPRARAPYK